MTSTNGKTELKTKLPKKKTSKPKKKCSPRQYKRSSLSKQKDIPDAIWEFFKIPLPRPEYQFHPVRKWAIDYAWPDYKVALEIEGGIWTNGRHVRPIGYLKDMEKYNSMVMHGWLLLRYAPSNIDYEQIRNAIQYRKSII